MGRPKKQISEQNIENFQRDIELAGNRTDLLLKDKKGRSKSCLLCRRRKQRCDHKLPSCTACLKANVKCVQPVRYIENLGNIPNNNNNNDTISISETSSNSPISDISTVDNIHINQPVTIPDLQSFNKQRNVITTKNKITKKTDNQYTNFLEKKLKYLEKLIDLPIGGVVFQKKLKNYKKVSHLLGNIEDFKNDEMRINRLDKNVTNNNNNDNMIRDNDGITTTTRDFRNQSGTLIYDSNSSLPALTSDSLDSIDFSKCIFTKYLKDHFKYDPVFEFNENLSRSFLDIFFTRLQFKYPLLDEQEIYSFHNDYTKNKIYSCSANDFHFATGRMWLIFSISAYMHMTTGKYNGLPPIRYFSTAVRHITKCGDNLNDVQRVELLTLLVLYLLRTDRDSLILYEIIKDIMHIVKNKLKLNKWTQQDSFANKKLRLFWCVYLLERMICVAIGKPFTIHESEIDVPLFNEDSYNTNKNSRTSGIHFINQSLTLRRIESNFVEKLNIIPSNKQTTPTKKNQLPTVKLFFNELEVWRSNCSTTDIRNFENETLKLYYYRAVRLLIQPYLEFLTPEDQLFKECQAAAGQICQLYKIFHQKTINGHSTPAVHTVFGAGVSLIYCMWLERNFNDERRKKLGDLSKHTRPLVGPNLFSTMDDLRACSVCLYVMTERSKFARVFRDTFDQLMNATVGNLIERCGPDSSELIYLTDRSIKNGPVELNNDIIAVNGEQKQMTVSIDLNKKSNQDKTNKDSITNSDVRTSHNGMPPAVARTFGKYQAEEHVGFVENSQVDLEEQRKLKQRQGILEQVAVPKSLAHLLVSNNTKLTTDSQSSSDSSDILKIKSKDIVDSRTNSANDNGDNNYIVQKPVYPNEFDWKNFQQQAFLQQQLAQQNLQAYLSSLNYSKSLGTVDTVGSINPVMKPDMTTFHTDMGSANSNSPSTGSAVQGSNFVSPALSDFNQLRQSSMSDPKHVVRNPSPSVPGYNYGIPSVQSNLNNTFNTTDGCSNTAVSSTGNTPNINHDMGISSIPPTYFQGSTKPNSGKILFDNCTHDMINNISTWTSNAIGDLVNVLPMGHKGATGNNIGDELSQNNENSSVKNVSNNERFPSVNGTMGYEIPRQIHNGLGITKNAGSGGFPEHPVNGTVSESVGTIRNVASSNQAEEFWTINDDYGFLT
ncbi:hypothetical protein C6P45_002759 [Maudiozyma exigua]|uniref:Zn(2)-C6 fungal-type domain-containing protein n=1 Tax=Maudiozyma exigua TaxID=34358 RepID=A0A9P6VUK5_MAUEX|nr:hypothetical protein C6P45_002759 [Kazachstania exigua]